MPPGCRRPPESMWRRRRAWRQRRPGWRRPRAEVERAAAGGGSAPEEQKQNKKNANAADDSSLSRSLPPKSPDPPPRAAPPLSPPRPPLPLAHLARHPLSPPRPSAPLTRCSRASDGGLGTHPHTHRNFSFLFLPTMASHPPPTKEDPPATCNKCQAELGVAVATPCHHLFCAWRRGERGEREGTHSCSLVAHLPHAFFCLSPSPQARPAPPSWPTGTASAPSATTPSPGSPASGWTSATRPPRPRWAWPWRAWPRPPSWRARSPAPARRPAGWNGCA